MPDLAYVLLISLFSLLKLSFLLSLAFLVPVLLGIWLKKKISKKEKEGWLKSAFISTEIICFLAVLLAYLYFPLSTYLQNGASLPYEMPIANFLIFMALSLIRTAFVSLAVALMLMPFILVGNFILEGISERISKGRPSSLQYFISLFLSIWIIVAVALLLAMSLFKSSIAAVFYFVFFAFG